MPINPKTGESQDDFLSRCIPVEIDAGKPRDQAVAICMSKFTNKKFDDTCEKVVKICDEIVKK